MEIQGLEYLDVAVGFVATYFGSLVLGLIGSCVAMIYFATKYTSLSVSGKDKRLDIYLRLSEKNVQRIQALVNGPSLLINQRQCRDLSSKLSRALQNIQELVSQCDLSTVRLFRLSFKNLHRVLEVAESLVEDCGSKDWIAAAAFQIHNENAFRVILLEVGLCYDAIYEQARGIMREEWNSQQEDLRNSPTFQPASTADVDDDHDVIRKRLEDLFNQSRSSRLSALYHFVLERASKKLRLAHHLLLKLQCVPKRSHPVSDDCELPRTIIWTEDCYPFMTWTREVSLGPSGVGAGGVNKTSWLGVPCAKKYNILLEHQFLREAGILCHVNHPNIVTFICCGNEKKNRENHRFIATELMEMSLAKLIEEQAEPLSHFPHHVAVDIMVQIARGVCYLHGRRVAHRDLKPHNVVLNGLTSSHNEGNYHVKLVDFGVSKTQVEPLITTTTQGVVGTKRYVAPEVRDPPPGSDINDRRRRAIWFKADAWSFAVTCLEIFSLKRVDLNVDENNRDVKSLVPESCSDELVKLLQDCVQIRARDRPDFLEIYTRLEMLRHNLLRGNLQEVRSPGSASHEFIETVIREHFEKENAERICDDEESLDKPIPSDTPHLEERDSSPARSRRGNEACNSRSPDWIDQPGNEQFKRARDDWLAEGEMYDESGRRSRQQSKAFGVDIVTLLGWYIVVDELLFWAVAESGYLKFNCRYWWLAFSLSVLATLFTVPVVIGRFRSVLSLEEDLSSCEHKSMVYYDRAEKLLRKRGRFSFTLDVTDPIKPPPKQTTLWVFSVLVLFSCLLRWCVKSVSGYEVLCHSDKSMTIWTLNVLFVSSLSVALSLLVASSYIVRGSLIIRLLVFVYKSWRKEVSDLRRKLRKRITVWRLSRSLL